MKESTGANDNLAVRWDLPNGTTEQPIPAIRFLPPTLMLFAPTILEQPTNVTVAEKGSAEFTVRVSNRDPLAYQWYRNQYAIFGATSSVLRIANVGVTDHNSRYTCVITNGLGWTNSDPALLTVLADTDPPRMLSAFNRGGRTVVVVFSEPVYGADLASNFRLTPGAAVESAAYDPGAPARVILSTSPLSLNTTYTLAVTGVVDRSAAANPIPPGSQVSFTTTVLTSVDIGNPAIVGTMLSVSNGFDVTAGGTGFGGASDQGHFVHQAHAGNFDFRVRVETLGATDPWSAAGLMARESLNPNSRFVGVFATPTISGCYLASRAAAGAAAALTGSFPPNYPATWLRLQRAGDLFTGLASWDGQNWALLGSVTNSMTNIVLFGLAASSHNAALSTTASFRDLGEAAGGVIGAGLPAGYEPLGPSSRRTGLVISEIMYHPPDRADGMDLEYIELFNAYLVPEDIGGWRLAGEIEYTFPPGTALAPGAFLVVAKSPADVQSVYGLSGVLGPFANRLSNRAAQIQLIHRLGAVVLDARYDSRPPWPVSPDGAGHSLVLARPSYGEGRPQAWAASRRIGGSPGRAEIYETSPLDAAAINEFLAHTDAPELDFIELYNHSLTPINLAGCILSDDPAADKYVFPAGVQLPARGWLALRQDALGFALSAAGEVILLRAPDRRVIDAVRFEAQARSVSAGRHPDGAPSFHPLAAKTPGSANAELRAPAVVIHEIMYHPVSGDDDQEEYVEIFNRAAEPADLSGWRFTDGIDFTIPEGVTVPARGFLVVAHNAQRMLENYTNLTSASVVGDFTGNLANDGERIALARPENLLVTNADLTVVTNRVYVIVDEVAYDDSGRWAALADGAGSSLELRDAAADNRRAPNWAASDETGKSQWTLIEHSGILDNGRTNYGIGSIEILMLDAGECLVDDIEVLDASGNNMLSGGTFEGGAPGWEFRGNHKYSMLLDGEGYQSSRSLWVRASGRGDTGPNQILCPLIKSFQPGDRATIRARVRWLSGHPEIVLRLHGNFLEATGPMMLPASLGTPGLANSRSVTNAGPALFEVSHQPILPAPFQAIVVTARAHDPQGVASILLNYRYDPSVTVRTLPMTDDGAGGDAVAGDGLYSATIPGQASGVLVAFSVQASDRARPAASSRFPDDAPARECLVRIGETMPPGNLGVYRLWFTQATEDEWSSRERGSNHPLDATFAYGAYRAVYNMQTYYSGSPYHWGNYDSPVGRMCHYVMVFPGDDRFLGATDFVLNAPSNLGNDSTAVREQTVHWMANQLGLPSTHRRFVQLYVMGLLRSRIFEDVQQPSRDFIEEWFPGDPDGDLHKIEDWFEYNSTYSFVNRNATLERYVTGGELKRAPYRWMWRKRAVRGSANDYANLFALVEAVNQPDADAFTREVESLVDIEQWMRTMALRRSVGDWDSYGYRRGKNMYAYKPERGRWQLMSWDISFAMGMGDGVTADLFLTQHSDGTPDPINERKFNHPPFRRMYLRAFQDIVDGPFRIDQVGPVLEAKSQALQANGIGVTTTSPIYSWINARADYIRQVLASNAAPFTVTTGGGAVIRTNRSPILLEGAAPVAVRTIRINGVAYDARWTTVTNWTIAFPLSLGTNSLEIVGYDSKDQPVTNATAHLTVQYTGPAESIVDRVVINEIMYHPDTPDADYIELYNASMSQTFDLSRAKLDGADFTFADGTLIGPQQCLVIVKDSAVFADTYGGGIPIAGEFQGRLDRGGETLKLVFPGATPEQDLLVDRVTYDDVLPWPPEADGTGSSLQLIDPLQDNQRVANWTAVNTNGYAPPRWRRVAVTGKATGSRLELSLGGAGDVYLDDLTLVAGIIPQQGPNLLQNGDFELPIETGWAATASYSGSGIATDRAYAGLGCLHLVCSSDSPGPGESLYQLITPPLATGQFYTLSYWYLAGASAGQLTVKLAGDGLVSSHEIALERLAYRTPGEMNSVRASLPPFPPIWLNEVQPLNPGVVVDGAGQADPWIELFNAGSSAVSLGGYYLTDDLLRLQKWAFPAGAGVGARQFLLVWADDEPGQTAPSELHAAFRLAPTNGSVAIVRMQNQQPAVVDYLHYRGLTAAQSYGRYPDGHPQEKMTFATPTPGRTNNPASIPVTVVINEWMAANTRAVADPADGDFDDWFELFNPSALAADLGGFTLTDDPDDTDKFSIPPGTVIEPGGYLLVWADEENRQNSPGGDLHVNFRLSQAGEFIGLYAPDGRIVDSIAFGPQKDDVSQGRWPNGQSGTAFELSRATPRAANAPPAGIVPSPTVLDITVDPDEVRVTFRSEPGLRYWLQWSQDPVSSVWQTVGESVIAYDETTSLADTSAGAALQRFYRIMVESAP